MNWSRLHTSILADACAKVLGSPKEGSMAFIRCLPSQVMHAIKDVVSIGEWKVWHVAQENAIQTRTITADRAVEQRENKREAILLLVDVAQAGAGMDGIYSAAYEVTEEALFKHALRLARRKLSSDHLSYADAAIKKARRNNKYIRGISPLTEFDFLCQVSSEAKHPGAFLYLLGLWPVQTSEYQHIDRELHVSGIFVDRLLSLEASYLPPRQRIAALGLQSPTETQKNELERFLISSSSRSLRLALEGLVDRETLWVNALQLAGIADDIQSIALIPWRNKSGKIYKWSGLNEKEPEEPPSLYLDPAGGQNGTYTNLEVRWKAKPDNLEKNAIKYRVDILSDLDEIIASQEIFHSARTEEKCKFSNDDFEDLHEDALISAKIKIGVIGKADIEDQEGEEFIIRFGQPPEQEQGGIGQRVRAFSEGLIDLDERETVADFNPVLRDLGIGGNVTQDTKGFLSLRIPRHGKSFRVFYPPLIQETEKQWRERRGELGYWRVSVRSSGVRAGEAEFKPIPRPEGISETLWERTVTASRRMAERFSWIGGSVGQVYDARSKLFNLVKEYLLSWAALLEEEKCPLLTLVHTVRVRSLSGKTIGLIVLPSHPLRVAWYAAYDNLVLHTAYNQKKMPAEVVRNELSGLDGAMFPAWLPGFEKETSFIFGDLLGFHAVGMVLENHREPKAAVAMLARALNESDKENSATSIVEEQSHLVLGKKVIRYLDCHLPSKQLRIHALRAGDGLTVARSLGHVHKHYENMSEDDGAEGDLQQKVPAFSLEFYPSFESHDTYTSGRFLTETRKKYRSRAGRQSLTDYWMLEALSLPGGVVMPKLRWALKDEQYPNGAAHLAIAFNMFENRVVVEDIASRARPFHVFGMLSFFDRQYTNTPYPLWCSTVLSSQEGEKHPADRAHTERLVRLQNAIHKLVALNCCGIPKEKPVLRTELPSSEQDRLLHLHRLCDWVITFDRNVGMEFFDSPRDNSEVYETYVIDCAPERDDLGCLQMITSTSNVEEVSSLINGTLDQMGLSRSRRNAEFLLQHLKAISGKLAIRLTGQKPVEAELIALALSHANCLQAVSSNACWLPLKHGFLIPIDDIQDLISSNAVGLENNSRPDFVHVSMTARSGLCFRFIEVKYRRNLRGARTSGMLERVREQVVSFREKWHRWYDHEKICQSFRSIRRAKLARMLYFYANKANRYYLPNKIHESIISEIDRMVEKGGDYDLKKILGDDRGWIFCPEYLGIEPLKISPDEWNDIQIFLFGPNLLPDSNMRLETNAASSGSEIVQTNTSQLANWKEKDAVSQVETISQIASSEEISNKGETIEEMPLVCLGMDELTGDRIQWPLTTKGNPHLLIAGLPGMGKTTCILNLCKQMIASDVQPIIFSYHQDVDEQLEKEVGSIRFVDFGNLGFNPMHIGEPSSPWVHLDIAGALRDIFMAIYPELGDIQGESIRKAIKDSFVEVGWGDADADVKALTIPSFNRFVEILRQDLRSNQRLLARLEELWDYGFFDVQEYRESLWKSKQPIIIRIHTRQNENLQKAFASMNLYGLYKSMFHRNTQNRITHVVIFDEAHRAASLKLIPTMAKECRKYGIALVLASQEAKDFNSSLYSAVANYLVLRLTATDARLLVKNVASSQQERVLIDKVKQMDRFKALYFQEGRRKPSTVELLP